MSAGGDGQIFVNLLLQTQAFEQKMNTALNEMKKFGTTTVDLNTSVTKTEQSFGNLATKTTDLTTKTGTLAQKTGELKPKEDAAGQGAEQLGNKAQKAGTDLQTMGSKSSGAGSALSNLGQRFKESALAIAGFTTSLFNTFIQYDSIKDQELTLEKTRKRLKDETTNIANAQRELNIAVEEGTVTDEEAIIKQNEIDENLDSLKTKQELYTDAVEDHKNAWKGFALSLAPTIITGLAAMQGLLGKVGVGAVGATKGVGMFGSGIGGLILRFGPIGIALTLVGGAILAIKNNMFGARDAVNNFGVAIGNAMPALIPLLNLIKGFGIALGILPKEFATIERDMTTGVYNIKEGFSLNFTEMIAKIQEFGQGLVKGAQEVGLFAAGVLEKLVAGNIVGAFTDLGTAAKTGFSEALAFVQNDLVPAVTSFIEFFGQEIVPRLPELIDVIIEGLGNAWEWTTDVIDKIWEAFMEEVESWFDDEAKGFVENWIEAILKAFGWKQEDIDKVMEDFSKFMKDWAEDPSGTLGEVGTTIATKVIEGLTWTGGELATLWNDHMTPLLTEMSAEIKKLNFAAIGEEIGAAVVGAIVWIGKALTAAWTGTWSEFITEASSTFDKGKSGTEMTQMGNSIAQAVVDAITFAPEMFSEFWKGFMSKAIEGLGLADTANFVNDVIATIMSVGKQGGAQEVTETPVMKFNEPTEIGGVSGKKLSRVGVASEVTKRRPPVDFLGSVGKGIQDFFSGFGLTPAFGEEGKGGLLKSRFTGKTPMAPLKSRFTPETMGLRGGIGKEGEAGGMLGGLDLDTMSQMVSQKTTEISAMFLTMKEAIIAQMVELQTFLGTWSTAFMGTFGTAVSVQTTLISSYFLTMKDAIILQMTELQTILGNFATNILTTLGTTVSTQTTLISSYFLTMKDAIVIQLTELQVLLETFANETLATIGTAVSVQTTVMSASFLTMSQVVTGLIDTLTKTLTTFVDKTLKDIGTKASQQTTIVSAAFLTMKDVVEGFIEELTDILMTFVDDTITIMGDTTTEVTETMIEDFEAMAEGIEESVDNSIDAIDDLIDKLEDLIQKQKEAKTSGGGGSSGGGGLKSRFAGVSRRFGGSHLAFQDGGSFISTIAQDFMGARISEHGKWERVDVTPLSNPHDIADKNSLVMPNMMVGNEAVNMGAGIGNGGIRPIIVKGILNAVLQTTSGREMARTTSPFILEYSEAQF